MVTDIVKCSDFWCDEYPSGRREGDLGLPVLNLGGLQSLCGEGNGEDGTGLDCFALDLVDVDGTVDAVWSEGFTGGKREEEETKNKEKNWIHIIYVLNLICITEKILIYLKKRKCLHNRIYLSFFFSSFFFIFS